MNPSGKKPSQRLAAQIKVNQRVPAHPQKHGLVQPKASVAPPARRPLVAPPVYRPQPAPKVLQTKKSGSPAVGDARTNRVRATPPPVYRPQPTPKVLQRTVGVKPPRPAIGKGEPALATSNVLQTKAAGLSKQSPPAQHKRPLPTHAVSRPLPEPGTGRPKVPTSQMRQPGGVSRPPNFSRQNIQPKVPSGSHAAPLSHGRVITPPAAAHPLLKYDNVIVTAHTAGVTREARANIGRIAAEQMLDALDGKPVSRIVNPQVWPDYAKRFERAFGFMPRK